jgi:uncharacterized protein DUF3761
MKAQFLGFLSLLFLTSVVWAAPAQAPAGATAECKDGSYYSGSSKRGACSRHGGIQTWYGSAAAPEGNPVAPNPPATTQTAPAPIPAGPMDRSTAQPPSKNQKMAHAPIAQGGGQVWVNTDSKVYHCPGTHWYGATKKGEYMSESEARAQGNRPDHNKPCSQ